MIELAFSKLKTLLRDRAERTVDKPWELCASVLDQFTELSSRNDFKHCGLRVPLPKTEPFQSVEAINSIETKTVANGKTLFRVGRNCTQESKGHFKTYSRSRETSGNARNSHESRYE